MRKLADLEAAVNADIGSKIITHLSTKNAEQVKTGLSTGSMMLNMILSGNPRVGYQWGRIIELYGPESCLDAETFIQYEIRDKTGKIQNHKGSSIRRLYERFHGITRKGKWFYQRQSTKDSVYFVQSRNEENAIFLNRIADVVFTGRKECFRVRSISGKEITCTEDHKFFVGTQYKSLKELTIEGDSVFVHSNIPYKGRKKPGRYLEVCVKYHPNGQEKVITTNDRNGNKRFVCIEDQIESIVPVGYRETYDIKCFAPYNNFVADGFVVHNSGKTTLALHAIAEAQKLNVPVMYIDAEHALDPLYMEAIGINLEELSLIQPDFGEQSLNGVIYSIKSGYKLVVIDSVAALTPKAELDGDMGDAHVGRQARMMGQGLRKMVGIAAKAQCTVIFINQIREKVGVMFGNPETTPGGRALKFAASYRIEIRSPRGGKIQEKDMSKNTVETGTESIVKTAKNKLYPPFRNAPVTIVYGRGIDKYADMVAYLKLKKVFGDSGKMMLDLDGKKYTGKTLLKALHTGTVSSVGKKAMMAKIREVSK